VDVVGTLKQRWDSTRGTALFEWHLCNEFVPPLRSLADVGPAIAGMEDERVARLGRMPPFRIARAQHGRRRAPSKEARL
jgi:hypothetical protein